MQTKINMTKSLSEKIKQLLLKIVVFERLFIGLVHFFMVFNVCICKICPFFWGLFHKKMNSAPYIKNDRYFSLLRWNQLSLLDTDSNPNLCRSAYVLGYSPISLDPVAGHHKKSCRRT